VTNIYPVRQPRDVLATALRDLRIATQAKLVFERFPDLGSAAEGLAWLMSERMPYPLSVAKSVPLLHLCLKHAFEWLNYDLSRQQASLRTSQTAFMAGLMLHAPEVVLTRVEAGELVWSLSDSPGLCEWLPEHPGATFTSLPDPPAGTPDDPKIRLLMLGRILPFPLPRLDVNLASVLMPPDALHPPRGFYGR